MKSFLFLIAAVTLFVGTQLPSYSHAEQSAQLETSAAAQGNGAGNFHKKVNTSTNVACVSGSVGGHGVVCCYSYPFTVCHTWEREPGSESFLK